MITSANQTRLAGNCPTQEIAIADSPRENTMIYPKEIPIKKNKKTAFLNEVTGNI